MSKVLLKVTVGFVPPCSAFRTRLGEDGVAVFVVTMVECSVR